MYIKWCICGRRILKIYQMEENKNCDICQQEHSEGLSQRVADWQKDKEEEK